MNREGCTSSPFFFTMGLLKIKKIGYGLDGKTLDLTIAIPEGSTISKFYVANQNDIPVDGSTRVGIEYIQAVKKANNCNVTEAFEILFNQVGQYTEADTGNIYDVYKLNQNAMWSSDQKSGIGITVSQNDLTYLTMELRPGKGNTFKYPTECGEDSLTTVYPLYNLLVLRLRALSEARFTECACDTPDEFIDKILQIKTIELATSSRDYYKAAMYWNRFYKGRNIGTNKRCGCHG